MVNLQYFSSGVCGFARNDRTAQVCLIRGAQGGSSDAIPANDHHFYFGVLCNKKKSKCIQRNEATVTEMPPSC